MWAIALLQPKLVKFAKETIMSAPEQTGVQEQDESSVNTVFPNAVAQV